MYMRVPIAVGTVVCAQKKRCGLGPSAFEDVVLPGFEPGQTEPKPVVLPLHHKTVRVPPMSERRCKGTYFCDSWQVF